MSHYKNSPISINVLTWRFSKSFAVTQQELQHSSLAQMPRGIVTLPIGCAYRKFSHPPVANPD